MENSDMLRQKIVNVEMSVDEVDGILKSHEKVEQLEKELKEEKESKIQYINIQIYDTRLYGRESSRGQFRYNAEDVKKIEDSDVMKTVMRQVNMANNINEDANKKIEQVRAYNEMIAKRSKFVRWLFKLKKIKERE